MFKKCEENKKPDPPVPPVVKNEVDVWITKGDESVKLQKQTTPVAFTVSTNVYQNIDIDVSQTYQTVDGFGYTLTGGSAEVINTLSASKNKNFFKTFSEVEKTL